MKQGCVSNMSFAETSPENDDKNLFDENVSKPTKRKRGSKEHPVVLNPFNSISLHQARMAALSKEMKLRQKPQGAFDFKAIVPKGTSGKKFHDDDEVHRLDEALWLPPFRVYLIGEMESGKTTLLHGLLTETERGYNNIFDYVLIFTKNLHTDDWSWTREKDAGSGEFLFPQDCLFTEFIPEHFKMFVEKLIRENAEDEAEGIPISSRRRALVVLDDFLTLSQPPPLSQHDNSIIDSRHANLSFLLSGQRFNAAGTLSRSNMNGYIYWPGFTDTEETAFIKDCCSKDGMSPKQIKDAFRKVSQFEPGGNYVVVYKSRSRHVGDRIHHCLGGPHLSLIL